MSSALTRDLADFFEVEQFSSNNCNKTEGKTRKQTISSFFCVVTQSRLVVSYRQPKQIISS
jgi:hypothetical protein